MARYVRIIGWSTALFSIIIILSDISNLLSNPMEQLQTVFALLPQARSGTNAIADMFHYNRIWSVYSILYFSFVLFVSIKFIRFQAIGRMLLEIACWIGIVNACVDSCISYVLLKQMQKALSDVIGTMGVSMGNINPLGTAAIILGFFLWIIPTLILIVYLRKPELKALMK